MATPISSFNNRKIQRIVFNGREIRIAVFNGLVVWTNDDSEPRLSLEKLSVFLSEQNNFQDTNQVYSYTTFSVGYIKKMAEVTKKGIVVNPSTGSGDTTLKVKAQTPNSGNRVKQSAEFTVTAPGVSEPKKFTANLLPKEEFVSFDNSSPTVDKAGGVVTITGKSNSQKLTFKKGAGDIITEDISSIEYQANGSNTVNGVAIDGDPGATAQYTFTLTLNAVENETIDARTQQITVEGAGGSSVSATLTLNQTARDPTLEASPTSIDVPHDGSEVQVQVTTNTTFTVS